MLRVVNPFVGKAFMASNPRTKKRRRTVLSRTKGYRRVKRSLARRGFSLAKGKGGTSRMIHFGKKRRSGRKSRAGSRRRNFMTATAQPARTVLPNMRELSAEAQTAVVGVGALMLSNAIGKAINKGIAFLPVSVAGPMQGFMGIVKFAGRYIGARALSLYVFNKPKGILSKANGALVKELVVITGGLALAHDMGAVAMLPAQVQVFIPQLSGMSAIERMGISKYVHGGTLSKYVHGGTLSAYARGTPRNGISAYTHYQDGWNRMSPPSARNLGRHLPSNLDQMPTETPETSNYGIPFGH